MGIYWLKYSLNLAMNLMHHSSVAVALFVGGWMALEGRIEVGTRRGDRGRARQAQRPVGRPGELGPGILGRRGQVPLFAEAADWLAEPVPGLEAESVFVQLFRGRDDGAYSTP